MSFKHCYLHNLVLVVCFDKPSTDNCKFPIALAASAHPNGLVESLVNSSSYRFVTKVQPGNGLFTQRASGFGRHFFADCARTLRTLNIVLYLIRISSFPSYLFLELEEEHPASCAILARSSKLPRKKLNSIRCVNFRGQFRGTMTPPKDCRVHFGRSVHC